MFFLGLVFLVICICHSLYEPDRNTSIRLSLKTTGDNVIILNRAHHGYYHLYIAFSGQPDVIHNQTYLNSNSPMTWRANLSVTSEGGNLFNTDTIHFQPAMVSEGQNYFRIASWQLVSSERLKIKLSPHEQFPMNSDPQLAIMADRVSYSRAVIDLTWPILYSACAILNSTLLMFAFKRKRQYSQSGKTK